MNPERKHARKEPGKDLFINRSALFDSLRSLFYESTGLGLSFYSAKTGEYDFYPKKEKSKYCKLIQEYAGVGACHKCDRDALLTACENNEYCFYRCHAGLQNVVVPVVFKGDLLGAMIAGQVVIGEKSVDSFRDIMKGFSFSPAQEKKLLRHYLSAKSISKEHLVYAIKLTKFMVNYILSVENERFLQNEVFRQEERLLQYENYRMHIESTMQGLSIKVLQDQVRGAETESRPGGRRHQATAVKNAIEVMRRMYRHPLTVAEIAKAVYLSPNYFSSVFKEATGKSFKAYLTELRMSEARSQLADPDKPIKEIARNVGFEDYNYFNKVFKAAFGAPPASFRKTLEEKTG